MVSTGGAVELALGGAALLVGVVSVAIAWLQWRRPRGSSLVAPVPEHATTDTWDVFVVVGTASADRVRHLVEALRTAGISVCLDQDVVVEDADRERWLRRRMRASTTVVILTSSRPGGSTGRRWDPTEITDAARRESRPVLALRLDDSAPQLDEMSVGTLSTLAEAEIGESVRRIAAVVRQAERDPQKQAEPVFCERIPAVSQFFTGRDEILHSVRASLQSGRPTVVTQAIHGLGGVGKTSIAAAIAESVSDEVEIVWWVRAEEPSLLVADLAELAPYLGVSALDEPAQTAALVRRRLESSPRSWLVVFDNAPDERAIEGWLPRRGRGSVLITSRSANFALAGRVVQVDTFAPDVATRFLRHRVESDNPAAASERLDAVVERLGGLPLALEQAGAWVAQVPNRRFRRFVELFDDVRNDPFPDGTRPSGYERTTTTTWTISVEAAGANAPQAGPVLDVLSFFAPDGFPCQWLRNMSGNDVFGRCGASEIDRALDALHVYSLARISQSDTVAVHRVVQAVTRRNAPIAAARGAIETLCRATPTDVFDDASWPTFALLVPHAVAVAETAVSAMPGSARDLCSLLNRVATFQHISGPIRDAVATAILAEHLATGHLADEDRVSLASFHVLEGARLSSGEPHYSVLQHREKLATAERALGRDHVDMLALRNNLAFVLQQEGDLGGAIDLFKKTLADRERVLGPDHYLTLINRNNLGQALQAAGELDRAIPLHEASLASLEAAVGSDHPSTLISRHNLASAYLAAGHTDRAIQLFERTLADRERALGLDHIHTIASRKALAEAYMASGRVEPALPLLEETLFVAQTLLVPNDPRIQAIRETLDRAQAQNASGGGDL